MTLIRPVITEKSMLAASRGVFTFVVELHTSKDQVRSEVESLFKVHVTKVTARNVVIPARRTGSKRLLGQPKRSHVMCIWLKSGEKIALFDIKDQK